MKHTPDKKPCDCIELLEGVWVQRCDCQNSGDLAAAESWCGDANRGADLREALDALMVIAAADPARFADQAAFNRWVRDTAALPVRKHGRAV